MLLYSYSRLLFSSGINVRRLTGIRKWKPLRVYDVMLCTAIKQAGKKA